MKTMVTISIVAGIFLCTTPMLHARILMIKFRKTFPVFLLVALANTAVLVFAEVDHSQAKNQSESAKVRLMKKLGGFFEKQDWPPYPMITKPQLILLGKIVDSTDYALLEGHENDQIPAMVDLEHTVATVQIIDQLKGKLSEKVIFLMKKKGWASLPFGDDPPSFYRGKYLLFLEPITEERCKNFERDIRKLKLPPKLVFQTCGGFQGGKGAIALEMDPEPLKGTKISPEELRSSETSNQILKNKYGEIVLATIPKTIKDLCGYLRCQKPQEQSDYLERLKKMDEICQEFAEDASKDIKQPPP